MRIRRVDFPPEVMEAQRSGDLVVFAGAGVSIDPPSNCPDFKGLAEEIGGSIRRRNKGEAIDRYLGRLSATGVTVHEQVRLMLSKHDSQPNAVHSAIVGLFKTSSDLRLVTTNFDPHFTTAAVARFQQDVREVFCAPALPLGHDFNGIVYLHGSVRRNATTLVLTDADFGRAYITEAWATQFLRRLFSRYVVLFVGYSHEDMLLTYLARGLTAGSPGPGRFALTTDDNDPHWKNLGICPVHYPRCDSPDLEHSELGNALAAWAAHSQSGALDSERRIRDLIERGVPLEVEDRDHLEHALSEISTLRFFTRYAYGLDWLSWMEGRSRFHRLFAIQSQISESDLELADWFARRFAIEHVDEAISVFRRRQQNIGPAIWHAVAQRLFQTKPSGGTLSKWICVLIATASPPNSDDSLEMLLSDCTYPDDAVAALLLLDHLTRPALSASGSALQFDVEVAGSEYWLRQAWHKIFEPNLLYFSRPIAAIVTRHLTTAHLLLASLGKFGASWDPLSSSRGMIESAQQDHLHSGVSVLIDAACGALNWALSNDQALADALILQWSESDSRLLQRLAIFGVGTARHIEADDKLGWVLRRKLLYRSGLKHEVFLLIQKAYPLAEEPARRPFMEQVLRGRDPGRGDRQIADYEIFDAVAWLARCAPNCALATGGFAQVKQQHPEFGENPDFDFWIGSLTAGSFSGSTVTHDLSSKTLDELLAEFDKEPNGTFRGERLGGDLTDSIRETSLKSIPWGLVLATQAQARGFWSERLWNPLIGSWAGADLLEEEWRSVLGLLNGAPAVCEASLGSVVWLLERGTENGQRRIPLSLTSEAKSLADALWPLCEKKGDGEGETAGDWLTRAIHHPAGRVTLIFLRLLSGLQTGGLLSTDEMKGYEGVFTVILAGSSYGKELARVVLASQFHFLFNVSKEWTVKHVLPLLDPSAEARRARQCWHGFLHWGRWSDSTLEYLRPLYERQFPRIAEESESVVKLFCVHVAGISVFALPSPLDRDWLLGFHDAVNPQARLLWAWEILANIEGLDEQAKVNLWGRWLKAYWEARLKGTPVPLDSRESETMLSWALALGAVFPECVGLLLSGPPPNLEHSFVYRRIAQSELLKRYPEDVAALLQFVTDGDTRPRIYDLGELRDAVQELIGLVPSCQILHPLCENLARLGVPDALDLEDGLA